MNAFLKEGLSLSGAYYFKINDEFIEKDEYPYKMQGKTLNDAEIFSATDKDAILNKKSKSTGIRFKNDNNAYANSPILQREEMDAYLKYAIKYIKNKRRQTMKNVLVIGIAGGSGSGKTTLLRSIVTALSMSIVPAISGA